MTEQFKFEELQDNEKKVLLSAYDYGVDEDGDIVDLLLKEKIISKRTKAPFNLKNVALLPGSLKIMDSDPLTISRYLREQIENES